jgi:hypothetical protein
MNMTFINLLLKKMQLSKDEKSNDWYSKLLNDKNFNSNEPYNYDKLINYFTAITEDLDHLKPFEILAGIFEFTKAFGQLSTALSMGFSDITSKVEIWRNLFKDYYRDGKDIQSVMITEVMIGIHELNGENNSSLGHKKNSPYYTYTSGSRTLLRLSWFLNFLYTVFNNLLETNEPFNNCVTNAYDLVLAPYHPWLVRKGAGLALSFAPKDRKNALKIFFGKFYLVFLKKRF